MYLDKDLCIFDSYMPSDSDIPNYLCIQAYNMVENQSFQVDKSKMLDLQLLYTVHLNRMEMVDKGLLVLDHAQLLDSIWWMDRQYIYQSMCILDYDWRLDILH